MSKLEELIQQYCPEGVEYKPLGEVSNMKRGTSATKEAMKEGEIPAISGGKLPAFYCDQFNRIGETITVAGSGAGAGYVQYWNRPIFVCDAFSVQGKEDLTTKFIYYFLNNIQEKIYGTKKGGGVPHVHISSIDKFEIPIPPLPVQEEIVRILDTFAELQTELQTELQKRKQQYNYYRDNLLSFEGRTDVEYLPIPRFAELKAGKAIKAEELMEHPDSEHSFPCFGGNGIRGYIGKQSHCGDFAIIGRQGALCGCVNWASGEFYATEHAVVCKPLPNANSRFLYHLLSTANLNQYKSQGAQPGLSVQRLNELVFPIPSLEEQERIASILDNYDALTNDLTVGLPAEIEKRRQQYEYYRDKLLTFKRKEA